VQRRAAYTPVPSVAAVISPHLWRVSICELGFVLMCFSGGTVEPNKNWGPCHKRVPAVVIECAEAAILAAFLRHLRAGFVFSASG
jgi:hypothetical protein